ncbi:STAS domain-containing protein [Sphaerisporangium fuscum]|uniref:STAS domain-containing protein n=1 Tax=Sphaerisporangium fuscum TaxID=2835868 RepID=UPI001BDCAD20|nr:STAS domain-containing protein [Sphaerisporangium fuscum]
MALTQHRPSGAASSSLGTPAVGNAGRKPATTEGASVTINDKPAPDAGLIEAVLHLDRTLRITYSPLPRGGVVRLVGELDAGNTPPVARTLTQVRAGEGVLTVDVAQLEFVDLAGLRMLIGLCRDRSARLAGVPLSMRRLLRLLNQEDVLGTRA